MANVNKEKMEKIKIPLVRGDKEDSVYVSINDRKWQVKKGVEVEVPACVAEVLRHEEEALLFNMEYDKEVATEE